MGFHRVSVCFVHFKKNSLALWTCNSSWSPITDHGAIIGPPQSGPCERAVCVLTLPNQDQMQPHCNSSSTGAQGESERASLEGKTILLSFPSEPSYSWKGLGFFILPKRSHKIDHHYIYHSFPLSFMGWIIILCLKLFRSISVFSNFQNILF